MLGERPVSVDGANLPAGSIFLTALTRSDDGNRASWPVRDGVTFPTGALTHADPARRGRLGLEDIAVDCTVARSMV